MDQILRGQMVVLKVFAWLLIVASVTTLAGAGLGVILYGR